MLRQTRRDLFHFQGSYPRGGELKRERNTIKLITDLSDSKRVVRRQHKARQGGLCGVQKHMDESHLSNTCFTYPRIATSLGGQVQQALQLSCPEAARQALLAPDAFDFIEDRITVRSGELGSVQASGQTGTELLHDVRIRHGYCEQGVADRLALFAEATSKVPQSA